MTLSVPTLPASGTLASSVPQTHPGHLNQGKLVLVVPTAWDSHDSSSRSGTDLNVSLAVYITMES